MASNETAAEVAKEFGDNIALMRKCKCVGVSLWNCLKFKLRFEAAHEREIAEKNAENAELREIINLDSASMAGKDAVIEELRAKLKVAEEGVSNEQ